MLQTGRTTGVFRALAEARNRILFILKPGFDVCVYYKIVVVCCLVVEGRAVCCLYSGSRGWTRKANLKFANLTLLCVQVKISAHLVSVVMATCNNHSSYQVDRVSIEFHEYICVDM